jgi:predicted GNAT family acetyltransferase
MADVEMRDDPGDNRYEAIVDGTVAGFTAYQREDGAIWLLHTEVDDAFDGQGVGSAMVRQLLDGLRAEPGLKVKVTCPFISTWIRRHPDYQDLLRR